MKSLILLLLFLTLTSCEHHEENIPRANEFDALALRLQKELPPNWSVEKSSDQIIVSRKGPITSHTCVCLDLNWLRHPELLQQFVEKTGSTRPYKIRIRVGPKLDLAEYRSAYKVNERIKVTSSTVIENREFYEDAALESYDPTYRELPIYFTEDASVFVETTLHPWECVYPPTDARECEKVRMIIDSFFVSYPDARIDKNLSWMGI